MMKKISTKSNKLFTFPSFTIVSLFLVAGGVYLIKIGHTIIGCILLGAVLFFNILPFLIITIVAGPMLTALEKAIKELDKLKKESDKEDDNTAYY